MAIKQSLYDKINDYGTQGATDEEIVTGLETSQNYPDIAEKVQGYRQQGITATDIMGGILSAEVIPDEPVAGEGLGAGVPALRPKPEEAAGRQILPGALEERSFVETIGAGLRRGTIGAGVGIGRGLHYAGELIGSKTVEEAGEGLADYAQGVLAAHPDWAAAKEQADRVWYHPERLAETIAEAIPMTVGALATTLAVAKGGAVVGLTAGAARLAGIVIGGSPFGIVSAGAMYDKAIEEGVDTGTAKWLAGTSGVLEIALESFGANKVLKMMGFDDLGKEAIKKAITKTELIKNIARKAGEMGKVEALEEFSQTVKDNLIVKYGIDEGQAIFEGGLQAAVVGGIMGLGIGGTARLGAEFKAVPGAEEKSAMPEVQALPKEVAEKIVADQTISGKRAQDIAAVLVPEIERQITPDKSAEESAIIMAELLDAADVKMTTEEVEAVRTPTEEAPIDKVADAAETVKAKLTETLDAIEPRTAMGAQVKDLLQEEVAKVLPETEQVVPEAELVPVVEETVPDTPPLIEEPVTLAAPAEPVAAPEAIAPAEGIVEEEIPAAPVPPFELVIEDKITQLNGGPNRQILEAIRAEVEVGEAGKRVPVTTPEGEVIGTLAEGSTFPEYFQDKGYKKKPVMIALKKALEGKKLAPGQERIVRDLHDSFMRARPEQIAALEAEQVAPVEGFELEPTPAAAPVAPTEEQLGLPIEKGQAELPKGKIPAAVKEVELIERPREIAAEKAQVKIEEAIPKSLEALRTEVAAKSPEIQKLIEDAGYKIGSVRIAINKALDPDRKHLLTPIQKDMIAAAQAKEIAPAVKEEVVLEKPVSGEFASQRVKIGSSPQPYKVLRELEATPAEVELGERFFEVENEKTGEVETVEFADLIQIKPRVISEKARDKAKTNIKEKMKGLKAGVDPTLLADYAVIGAYHFESGLRTFSAWGKKMIEEFGNEIKPHLNKLWKQAKTQVPKEAEVVEARKKVKPEAPKEAPTKKVVPKKEVAQKVSSRIEALRKQFKEKPTEGTQEEVLELAAEEKKLPGKEFGDHREYSAGEKEALSDIGVKPAKESLTTKLHNLRENLGLKIRQKVVDQYASLRGLSERGHILATLSNTSTGALEAALKHGKLRLTEEGGITVDETGKGLFNALSPLGEELDDFLGWIVGNRAKRLKEQGRERLFSDEKIKALIGLNKGTTKDGKPRTALYNKVLKDLNAFQKSVVDIAVKTGTINEAERATWATDFYVPFYRILEETEGIKGPKTLDALSGQTAVQKLKGADVPLNDILQNILMNWNHLLNASLRNQAGAVNLEAAEDVGSATQIKEKDKTKNSVFVRKDGQKVWYDVNDPLILESISSLNHEGFNSRSMKAMRAFKRAFTMGVTASPEFRIANLMRDTIHSVAVGKMKLNMIDNVFGKGWSGTKKDSLTRARMLAGGGEIHFGHLYGTDPEGAKLLIKKGIKDDSILDNPKAFNKFTTAFNAAWDSWNEFGSRLENINRAALYENRVKEVGHLKASFEARDLMNFTNSGAASSIRFLTQVVPFLNARMQGLDKMGRSFADKDQRNQFAVVTGGVALASMALYLAYKDDEDYKAREEWDKDTYWWFKLPGSDLAYRIPKPFEVGAIGTMAERMLEQVVDDDVHGELFAERFAHMIAETFSFSAVPQMVQPALDVYANKNPFTKRPIESLGMERLSPTERKKAWTSETAIGLSEAMDKVSWGKAVLSPVQVEHLVQGYMGWLGASTLGILDQIYAKPLGDFPVDPTRKIDDYPGIGRFVRSHPQRNTKYATMFYTQMGEMNQAYNDIMNYRKLGELGKATELIKKKGSQLRLRKYFNSVQRQMNKINRRLKLIHGSRTMSAEEKRNEIDLMTVRKNRLTKIAIERSNLLRD